MAKDPLQRLADWLARAVQLLGDRIGESEIQARRDILFAADQRNAREAADFVAESMPMARAFKTPREILEYALGLSERSGAALEFGVHTGTSLRTIRDNREGVGNIWGFDSFEGLPEDWRSGFPQGAFKTPGVPEVAGANFVVGWFAETLPGWLEENPTLAVDFLHIDCDLYSSTKTVLEHVGPRLHPGSIVVFDEFFNYTGWRDHEFRAWSEYWRDFGVSFEYIAYCHRSEQVVVRITG